MPVELMALNYQDLQDLLRAHFPGRAPRGFREHVQQAKRLPLESLLVYVEYCRRNMRWGHNEETTTCYEDVVKNVLLPELIERMQRELQLLTSSPLWTRNVLPDEIDEDPDWHPDDCKHEWTNEGGYVFCSRCGGGRECAGWEEHQ